MICQYGYQTRVQLVPQNVTEAHVSISVTFVIGFVLQVCTQIFYPPSTVT